MPGWALRLGSVLTTLAVLVGSFDYARANLKNPNAPLHPPVADASPAPSGAPAPTPLPPLIRPRGVRPTGTPAPALTLTPEVKQTQAPAVTFTHVS